MFWSCIVNEFTFLMIHLFGNSRLLYIQCYRCQSALYIQSQVNLKSIVIRKGTPWIGPKHRAYKVKTRTILQHPSTPDAWRNPSSHILIFKPKRHATVPNWIAQLLLVLHLAKTEITSTFDPTSINETCKIWFSCHFSSWLLYRIKVPQPGHSTWQQEDISWLANMTKQPNMT